MENYFFLIFVTTIVVIRVLVFVFPIPGPTILKFRVHHYIYGIVGIIISFFVSSVPLYAISLGLFIDELTYILIGGRTHQDNYSKTSLIGTVCFIVLVFFLRKYLVLFVL